MKCLAVLILEYMTTQEIADLWGIKVRQVQLLCEKGKVDNAKRIGRMWIIPIGTPKPIDGRTKIAKKQKLSVVNYEFNLQKYQRKDELYEYKFVSGFFQ